MTDYSNLEDSQLITNARHDAKAFDALYHRYLPRLYLSQLSTLDSNI